MITNAPPGVVITAPAAELLARLQQGHGPVMFHQSGGCCDGSSPMCYPRGDFLVGDRDVLLGVLDVGADGVVVWISGPQYQVWKHTQLVIDVVPGRGGGFSLEAPEGVRFLSRGRVFTDAEKAQLIFASGLSTAEAVTELAGRGVGMDVVRNEIATIGGRIDIATSRGQGTSFTVYLPLTLAVISYVTFIYAGMKKSPLGFWKNSLFPSGVPWPVYIIVTPLEFISTFIIRPVTLTLRLMMNLVVGHMILVLCFSATAFFMFTAGGGWAALGVGTLAFGGAFTIFEILVVVLQSYVFTVLTAIYIQLAVAEEH